MQTLLVYTVYKAFYNQQSISFRCCLSCCTFNFKNNYYTRNTEKPKIMKFGYRNYEQNIKWSTFLPKFNV